MKRALMMLMVVGMVAGRADAARLSPDQTKAKVIARLNTGVERGTWKVRQFGRRDAETRTFRGNDLHQIKVGPGVELTVGFMATGTVNTKTGAVKILSKAAAK